MNSPSAPARTRRLPVGAEASISQPGTHFRVWAPGADAVSVIVEKDDGSVLAETAMEHDSDGYVAAFVSSASSGALYRYSIGRGREPVPDPASRFQPRGPHGPSQVVAADAFPWTDGAWKGVALERAVMYELHVGTFTDEGSWRAAAGELLRLKDLGITMIEVMPVAEFSGGFGWGYDGVDWFAPSHLYGRPDDFRAFVDEAHGLGLGVMLDVVYNHFGPDGNYLRHFTDRYFSTRDHNEWGDPINFDEDAAAVREFVLANVSHWISEYHLDGLRIDATQQMFDRSSPHILKEIAEQARRAAGDRSVLVVAENEPQDARLLQSASKDGYGLDALWNDDFHHSAVVALTGRREAYYTDYGGSPQEMVSLAKWGFLFQGQRYSWQQARRGSPALDVPPMRFITFLENHDQVANAPWGDGRRLHEVSHPAAYRAMTAFWLLAPGTPLFFQGQEFGSSAPFHFFADHEEPLSRDVRNGRTQFMAQFRSPATTDLLQRLPVPSDDRTFRSSVLQRADTEHQRRATRLHRDLLALRRDDPAIGASNPKYFDGAVLGPQAFVIRYFAGDPRAGGSRLSDRLLLVNVGIDLRLDPAPEPLLAPPIGCDWAIHWSSEDPAYGGMGTAPLDTERNWLIPGMAAVLLAPTTT